ncbi:Vacuolar fusion protein MON1 [Escovopsis weberi]|uniref:Vacuolar fusion protein MON1 n=1 Tax=Escovopsis weberi TaxID=150374 RepID=A0A0M9VU95_ESCWE|nr:Vacuolar fusion protein MON1 [Escovopsis weberi]
MGPDQEAPPEDNRPPLPPRARASSSPDGNKRLQAQATTAVTALDIQTLSFPDGSRGTFSMQSALSVSTPASSGHASSPSQRPSSSGAEDNDGASVVSYAPTMRPVGDIASLLTSSLNKRSAAWTLLKSQSASVQPFERSRGAEDSLADFEREFHPLPEESNEYFKDDERLALWQSKMKHYMILSSSGKPIWSRHGDLNLINSSIGVVQTIISFYEGSDNALRGFTAGNTRFVVTTQGPLYFIAISKLGESDSQLRAQLEALYMQILSTLTLPRLTHIFENRPSSDLQKQLEGTTSLLSSLADNFTKGSPPVLLGALECLKLRKSQRGLITSTFLKYRSEKLLYGLIVTGGKLVSVIRPRRHSLHPSDLQLIFNMLFESEGIKGGGGENWIPLCLPAFNNRGYLYMYVSFFGAPSGEVQATPPPPPPDPTAPPGLDKDQDEETAIILISTDREAFFILKKMRDEVAQQLAKNGSLAVMRNASRAGRPGISQVAPGSPISHFLYKSRANVQFCMSTLEPLFGQLVERRRLMTVYHELHAAVHAKHAHLKILQCVNDEATSLAWVTPAFELYCIGGPNLSRPAMAQGANKIIQWVKKEENRLFIIGGGVF